MSVQLGFKADEIIAEGRVTEDDIKLISIWLEEQKHLPPISDEEIVNFLLSNDNDQKNTKNTINAFFKIRNEAPEIFNNRLLSKEDSESMQSFALTFWQCGIAPKRTKDNCAIIFGKLHDTSFKSFNISNLVKLAFVTLDTINYYNPPNGLIIIMDLEGFGLLHITKLKVRPLSVFFRYLQEALSVKLKNIHVLNSPYLIDKIMAIIKPLMNDNVNQLLIFHKRECNMDEFFDKYVPKELFPEDFGGELPSMKDLTEELVNKLKDMKTYFTVEEHRRSMLKS